MNAWVIVDDAPEETEVFAGELRRGNMLEVRTAGAEETQGRIEDGSLDVAGVLMDVDLSNEAGMRFTGPGLAQSIRVAQMRRLLPSFPIVRFSAREKIRENIGSDISSDDLFDLKIDKDGFSERSKSTMVRGQLVGLGQVYAAVQKKFELREFFKLSPDQWELWGHRAIEDEISVVDLPYLRAGKLIRVLVHAGILIDDELFAIRLGVDRMRSCNWTELCAALKGIRYSGVGYTYFPRWWARALEHWWQELDRGRPLAGTDLAGRVATLREVTGLDIEPLEMPSGSLGERPWRTCLLSMENSGENVPVDPTRGVRVIPRHSLPSWMDPLVAAIGPASRQRDDGRLDKDDLSRLATLLRE